MRINETIIVLAQQMRDIEARIFAAGMPVAALMEKAAELCFREIQTLYPREKSSLVGVVVGSGHNGGDALVVARELHFAGYTVKIYCPLPKQKELTTSHRKYAASLGIVFIEDTDALQECNLIIDGLFGFGLIRPLSGNIAEIVNKINSWKKPVVSIDLPSGINTDTGEILGTAIKATHTLCLGLWKRAFFQDQALEYFGKAVRLDFGIPAGDIEAVIDTSTGMQQITSTIARQFLPLPRPLVTHKYQQGNLLLVCGSTRYAGAAILNGLGARASGIGMLSIAVPESLKLLLVSQLPEALIIGCPETATGAIASLPLSETDLNKFDTIACGSGLTTDALPVVEQVLNIECPLVLDADALNIIARSSLQLNLRPNIVLTPHLGEFKRLFPKIDTSDRLKAVKAAAEYSNTIILLKGARSAVASPQGSIWVVPESTPALARGGSGDVLTGLIGGLLASADNYDKIENYIATAAFWHAEAGIKAAAKRTELGVDGGTLAEYLSYKTLSYFEK
ncbi:MAG: NAD(P)H-hydrate dehydratase [Xenococcaceae cyanobacterium MO_188.B19]|nr:NAD(P)H-hydrate dehydratase [Xenococcaceae cyanobacterium MO_188.B19]